jgi:hypothetical protein
VIHISPSTVKDFIAQSLVIDSIVYEHGLEIIDLQSQGLPIDQR